MWCKINSQISSASTKSENKARSCVINPDCNVRKKWEEAKERRHHLLPKVSSQLGAGALGWPGAAWMRNSPAADPV